MFTDIWQRPPQPALLVAHLVELVDVGRGQQRGQAGGAQSAAAARRRISARAWKATKTIAMTAADTA